MRIDEEIQALRSKLRDESLSDAQRHSIEFALQCVERVERTIGQALRDEFPQALEGLTNEQVAVVQDYCRRVSFIVLAAQSMQLAIQSTRLANGSVKSH